MTVHHNAIYFKIQIFPYLSTTDQFELYILWKLQFFMTGEKQQSYFGHLVSNLIHS